MVLRRLRRAVVAAMVLAALDAPGLLQTARAVGVESAQQPNASSQPLLAQAGAAAGTLELRVRRQSDGLDLVIEGTGAGPQLQQNVSGSTWQGRLITASPNGLRRGPQRLSLPELGLQSISIDGSGSVFRIDVTPMPGVPLARPVVSADGRNLILSFPASPQVSLQTLRPNLDTPGRVPQPGFVPPLQPRAVAPPVGDMAVGTMMIANPSYLNVSGPPVTMTLRNAPARDVLMTLAQLGGYGFVYVDEAQAAAAAAPSNALRPISIAFRNESYGRALNSALLAAGLQGKRDGNMILAGPKVLSKSFGAQMSKVYRLNQVSANSAADYLANLGASVTKTNTITTAVTQGVNQNSAVANAPSSATTQSSSQTTVEAYGAGVGPLVGLLATTDPRLSTVTLVGSPGLVSIGEHYLKQLDLRQRQVALSVKILDVSLENETSIDNSFAFRWGNNFIVNDRGQMLGAFGANLPATAEGDFSALNTAEAVSSSTSVFGGTSGSNQRTTSFQIQNSASLSDSDIQNVVNNVTRNLDSNRFRTTTTTSSGAGGRVTTINLIENLSSGATSALNNNATRNISSLISSLTGSNVSVSTNTNTLSSASATADTSYSGFRNRNPGLNYPADQFFNFVRAQIVSGTTKVLASPTLILSENPEEIRGGGEIAVGSGGSSGGSSSSGSSASQSSIGNVLGAASIGRKFANESFVTVGTQVVTNYEVETGTSGNGNTCQPVFSTAGLTFGARVSKIDDNGFVTFSISPTISAVTDREPAPSGCGAPLNILSVRRLDTGSVRVRDGQTLILTGVISDTDVQQVTKWPILGDIPLIGQFFRASVGQRRKNELVILVSPRIVSDADGGSYGYGYQPSTQDTLKFLNGNLD